MLNLLKASSKPKLKGKIEIDYVYQSIEKFTEGRQINAERVKPWGTAHAVLCCKGKVNLPFAVINADDYYGKDSFRKAFDFLQAQCNKKTYGVIGYELANTLSEHGSVSRGVIAMNDKNEMSGIKERLKIYKKDNSIVDEEGENKFFELSEKHKSEHEFFLLRFYVY